MKKRIASFFMALCFVIAMLPATALAAGEHGISVNDTALYTANISTTDTLFIVDDTVAVTVNVGGSFTVEIGTTPVTITVTKTLNTSSVNVQKYIQLNNKVMWLVTVNGNGTAQISGKTYVYNGQNMYWSSKYKAYCYLVVAETLDVETAQVALGNALIEANAIEVAYDMDVNTSGKVDANDAQLAYDMYQTKAYDGFEKVAMIKFLEADLNSIVGVDSTDVQVILSHLLNITK